MEWSYQVEAAHEEQRVRGVGQQASSCGAVDVHTSQGGEPVTLSLHRTEGKGGGREGSRGQVKTERRNAGESGKAEAGEGWRRREAEVTGRRTALHHTALHSAA